MLILMYLLGFLVITRPPKDEQPIILSDVLNNHVNRVTIVQTQITEITPIPTATPEPTKAPVVQPIKTLPKKEIIIVTATPTKPQVQQYDFKWSGASTRYALDYAQADKEYVKQRICFYFPDNCDEALTIASHESGYRTNAASSGYFATTNLGVFQLNCRWQKNRVGGDCLKFFDLETNLRVARQIYLEQKWEPWSTKVFL